MFPQCWSFSSVWSGIVWVNIVPGDPPRKGLLDRFSGVSPWVVLHRPCQGARITVSCFALWAFCSLKPFMPLFWVSGEKTAPWSPVLKMSDVMIGKSADSNGAYLLQFSPRVPEGTLNCAMFRFPQSLFCSCCHPIFLEEKEICPSLSMLASCMENVQPVQCWHTLSVLDEAGGCNALPCMDPTWTAVTWPGRDCGWWHNKLNILPRLLI